MNMNRAMKTASTLSFAGMMLALFALNVGAQPPGMMGQGQGQGMGMGGGMMMQHMKEMDARVMLRDVMAFNYDFLPPSRDCR